jgi:hypothetical protein
MKLLIFIFSVSLFIGPVFAETKRQTCINKAVEFLNIKKSQEIRLEGKNSNGGCSLDIDASFEQGIDQAYALSFFQEYATETGSTRQRNALRENKNHADKVYEVDKCEVLGNELIIDLVTKYPTTYSGPEGRKVNIKIHQKSGKISKVDYKEKYYALNYIKYLERHSVCTY